MKLSKKNIKKIINEEISKFFSSYTILNENNTRAIRADADGDTSFLNYEVFSIDKDCRNILDGDRFLVVFRAPSGRSYAASCWYEDTSKNSSAIPSWTTPGKVLNGVLDLDSGYSGLWKVESRYFNDDGDEISALYYCYDNSCTIRRKNEGPPTSEDFYFPADISSESHYAMSDEAEDFFEEVNIEALDFAIHQHCAYRSAIVLGDREEYERFEGKFGDWVYKISDHSMIIDDELYPEDVELVEMEVVDGPSAVGFKFKLGDIKDREGNEEYVRHPLVNAVIEYLESSVRREQFGGQ